MKVLSVFLLVITILLYSCSNEGIVDSSNLAEDANFVNVDDAKAYASVLEYQSTSKSGRTTTQQKK